MNISNYYRNLWNNKYFSVKSQTKVYKTAEGRVDTKKKLKILSIPAKWEFCRSKAKHWDINKNMLISRNCAISKKYPNSLETGENAGTKCWNISRINPNRLNRKAKDEIPTEGKEKMTWKATKKVVRILNIHVRRCIKIITSYQTFWEKEKKKEYKIRYRTYKNRIVMWCVEHFFIRTLQISTLVGNF